MKITWLGQTGLLLKHEDITIMVDPYLSNSVGKTRLIEVDKSYLDIRPDVLILTHNHIDHADPKTLQAILNKHQKICVLASGNAWHKARQYGGTHNYVMFNRGTVWTEAGLQFEAVYAEHSDEHAIGVIITCGEKHYYVAGDTLYNHRVVEDIKMPIDVLFVPINGEGNNMNALDAAMFSKEIGAGVAVPVHYGMYDYVQAEMFQYESVQILHPYKECEM